MNVVIVEDEHLSAQRLEAMLKKYDPAVNILAEIPSVAEAVAWFKANPDPDLVFMDIHLEDGQSFGIFDSLNLQVPVIFTTAFDEYTIRAFKVNSVDYLMKPLNYEELAAAIDKFKRIHGHEKTETVAPLTDLLQSLYKKEPEYKSRFLVSIGSRLMPVEVGEIQYFYSAGKISFLATRDGHRYPIDFSLDKLASLLDPKLFYRVNRQLIVKLSAIANIQVFSKGRIKLELVPALKEEVFVSLDKAVEFKEWLGK